MSEELAKKYREMYQIAFNEVYDMAYDFAIERGRTESVAMAFAYIWSDKYAEDCIMTKIAITQSLFKIDMPIDQIAYVLRTDSSIIVQWLNKEAPTVVSQ